MSWTKPTTTWETAEAPFSTNTGVLRITLMDNNGVATESREVVVGDLLMSREDTAADKNLLVPGGLLLGRRTADSLPASFSSRVLSRSHAQILIDRKGRVFIVDLGSMHGTKIRGAVEPLTARVATQLCNGDVVTLGKSVESKNENHNPLKMRINIRFGNDSSSARYFMTGTEEFATKAHVAEMAKSLGLADTTSPTRRRGYGLDESMLYESEPEDLLPRGKAAPTGEDDAEADAPSTSPNGKVITVDDDDDNESVVFLQSSPASLSPSSLVAQARAIAAEADRHAVHVPETLPAAEAPAPRLEEKNGIRSDSPKDEPTAELDVPLIPSSFPAEDSSEDAAEDAASVVSAANEDDNNDARDLDDDDEAEVLSIHSGFASDRDLPPSSPVSNGGFGSNWDAEGEYQYSVYSHSEHGSSISRSRSNSISNSEDSDNDDVSEDYHSSDNDSSENESSSESSSAHEDDDDESNMDMDSDNESTAPFQPEESPDEIVWRSQNIFSFSNPSVSSQPLASAAQPTQPKESSPAVEEPQVDEPVVAVREDIVNLNTDCGSQPQSFNTAPTALPPSPPPSDGAEVAPQDVWTRIASILPFDVTDSERDESVVPEDATPALGKRKFDEFELQQVDAGTNPAPLPAPVAVKDRETVPLPPGKMRRLAKNAGLLAVGIAIGSIGTIAGLLQMAE